MHKCSKGVVVPVQNAEFWRKKRLSNVIRDRRNLRALKREGWKVLIVWGCETEKKRLPQLSKKLEKFLRLQ
jgi:DNA mismatch endonuclease (patch repair protein)